MEGFKLAYPHDYVVLLQMNTNGCVVRELALANGTIPVVAAFWPVPCFHVLMDDVIVEIAPLIE